MSPARCPAGVAALALVMALSPGIGAAEAITVRSAVGVSPAAEDYLAANVRVLKIPIASGVDRHAVVLALCGSITRSYEQKLASENKTAQPDLLNFPACFYDTREAVSVSAEHEDTLRLFADRTVGAAGERTLQAILDLNPELATAAAAQGLTVATAGSLKLESGGSYTVPMLTKPVTYDLKLGVTAKAAIAALGAALGASDGLAARLAVAPVDARLDATVSEADLDCATPGAPSGPWPYDAAALNYVLTHPEISGPIAQVATLAILDSGLPNLPERFPPEVFAYGPESTTPDGADNEPKNQIVDDVVGANIALKIGDVAPDTQYRFAAHGVEMASLALGGPAYLEAYGAGSVAARVRLRIVNVVDDTRRIPTSVLPRALDYAAAQGAQVASMSLVTSDRDPVLLGQFQAAPGLLVTVAAGNISTDNRTTASYPAVYGGAGGSFKDRVLTVAAANWFGGLPFWSPRSSNGIDIAAAGCKVPVYLLDGRLDRRNGSSHATALAAFVAALLRSADKYRNATWIKARILAGADYSPDLELQVDAAGVLNPAKSMSLYKTVVETEKGKLRFGRLTTAPETYDLCEHGDFPSVQIIKLSWNPKRDEMRFAYLNGEGNYAHGSCRPYDLAAIKFTEDLPTAGTEETLPVRTLFDLVLADH